MSQPDNCLQYLLAVEELFNKSKNVDCTSFDPTKGIHQAACNGDIDYIRNHLDYINRRDEDGDTPLIRAAARGQYETCKFLIASGCNKHAINYYGFSAYHIAVDCDHHDIASLIGWTWFS